MSAPLSKQEIAGTWPPLCSSCLHYRPPVLLTDGSCRALCVHPQWKGPQIAWTARHELGCAYAGVLFEPSSAP